MCVTVRVVWISIRVSPKAVDSVQISHCSCFVLQPLHSEIRLLWLLLLFVYLFILYSFCLLFILRVVIIVCGNII